MEIEKSTRTGGVAVLGPRGRLNMVSAPELKAAVDAALKEGCTRILVNLTRVSFLDSSGLGALISGLKTARQEQGDLRIAAANAQVSMVLSLTNLDRLLRPYPTLEEAIDGW